MKFHNTDFLIIGGGIIGLNMALNARQRYPDSRVTIIEKEKDTCTHASGRNSGVLHAGFYYTADSLKAKFTQEGNQLLTEYCKNRGLQINQCGKLVVARNERELPTLNELFRRGQRNNVELIEVTEKEAKKIEPRVLTHKKALFSPTTSSIDPIEVTRALAEDARAAGVMILTDTAYVSVNHKNITTTQGKISTGYVINTAGLYADKIANDFGFSKDYRIVPFKGLYLHGDEPPGALKTNIYPVPNLDNPFLGVHFTINATGNIEIGPTAIPAFWREHYNGLENFSLTEMMEIISREFNLFLRNDFNFRKLAVQELWKYMKPRMVKLASELATGISSDHYRRWGKPGIRAQLFDIRKRKLEMDFRFEGNEHSFHVLNAVSPAFTCSMPFSAYLFDHIEKFLP